MVILTVRLLADFTQNKVPLDNKLNQILEWIDLPDNKRPQLILSAYNHRHFVSTFS